MCNKHYQTMHWQHHGGWGPRRGPHPGFFFFPPFALLFGIFMLVMLFKTGLWIPLLLIGLFVWGRHHRHGTWEKRKRDDWTWDWDSDDAPEKPKRIDYI